MSETADREFAAIAERDGITADQAFVLVQVWAWPIGLLLRTAFEKARDNHPDWQSWLAQQRPILDQMPTRAEWEEGIRQGAERESRGQ